MAIDDPSQASVAEREPARPARGARLGPALRGLLIGRPETGALFGAALMFVVFAFIAPSSDQFTSRSSLTGLASITAELGIIAMAVTLLMIAGHFDLSVGSVLGFSSFIIAHLIVTSGLSGWQAVIAAVAIAMSIGLVNGLLVVTTRIPSFIVTLGTLLVWRGVLFGISGGQPSSVPRDNIIFDVFSYRFQSGPFRGYQVSLLWFLAVLAVLTFLLLRTRFGNWIFASGGNERAARSMGVPVDRVWLILFVVTAAAACLTGLIQVGRFGVVESTRGQLYELQAIAAAVVGGARLNGGYGSVLGAALGALLITAVILNQVLGRSRPQV
jgi:simple sugar transport system permease protein